MTKKKTVGTINLNDYMKFEQLKKEKLLELSDEGKMTVELDVGNVVRALNEARKDFDKFSDEILKRQAIIEQIWDKWTQEIIRKVNFLTRKMREYDTNEKFISQFGIWGNCRKRKWWKWFVPWV